MTDWLNRCHFGDVRDVLQRMATDGVKVQTIITSPPYWGLRSYLPADHPDKAREIGSEPTLGEFIQTMVGVFDLCREVLVDDGTMWVNMGDSYAGSWGAQSREHGGKHAPNISALSANQAKAAQIRESGTGSLGRTPGLKSKDLMGQPWRLAFALQDAGWWLRQDIIWHKPNPMPESIKDRCTKAHEYIFLLSKSERYYFDHDAIKTPANLTGKGNANGFRGGAYCNDSAVENSGDGGRRTSAGNDTRSRYKMPDGWDTGPGGHGSFHRDGREKGAPPRVAGNVNPPKGQLAYEAGDERHRTKAGLLDFATKTRSARDSFKREDSKRAAAIPGQAVGTHRPDREESDYPLDSAAKRSVWTVATEAYPGSHYATFPRALIEPCVLAGAPAGGVVLDIFMGSGTTAQVCEQLGRRWIGIDIDVRNEVLQDERLRQRSLDLEAA